MGLLDVFNSYEGQQALGLLAAAGGRSDGAGFGQRLMEGLSQGDKWKAAQAAEKRAQMQEQMQQMQMQQMIAQAAKQKAIQEGVGQFFKPGQPGLAPLVGNAEAGILPSAGRAAVGPSVDAAGLGRFLAQNGDYATGLSLIQKQAPEFSPEVRYDQNGRAFMTAKNGEVKFLDGIKARDKLNEVRLGDKVGFRTDYSPEIQGSLPIGQSPDSKASNAVAWANNSLANKRFAFDQQGGADAGKPPAGYRWNMDKSGLEAIPGGPADIKAGELGAKAEAKKLAGIASADNVRSTITEAKDLVGFNTAGVGSFASKLPSTDARNLSAKLETIKGNLGFDRLQQMRDQSPTGGALGAVAVQELTALQSTVASLDQGQSPAQLKAALGKIDKHYANWQAVMRGENPYDNKNSPQGALGSGSFKILSVE